MSLAHSCKVNGMRVPVTFMREWDDGFGATGWKLDISAHDPEIIACTAFPGERIITSVLIHDILDHFVSGFGPSGHRNEGMALMQLHLRTGSYIRPDIEQMIKEDIFIGNVIGESLENFLPNDLLEHLPAFNTSNKEKMITLITKLGSDHVLTSLLNRFQEIGTIGIPDAKENWEKLCLNYSKRTAIGLCLQSLLENADKYVSAHELSNTHGDFVVGNTTCTLQLSAPYIFCMTLPVLTLAEKK